MADILRARSEFSLSLRIENSNSHSVDL